MQGRFGDTFGGIWVGTGVAGLALGVAALPVLGEGVFVCVGIGFRRSRVWQISLVFTLCVSGFWLVGIGFSVRLHFLVWEVWLFRGWPGLSGGDLECFLGSLNLVLFGRL